MCGIAGVVALQGGREPDRDMLLAMASRLRHRGPDGEGVYLHGRAGLAHRRLSIIDLEGGDQPIHNEDRTVWVVFNGEIFNFVELRRELEVAGHRFYTRSDTEVIVHAYEAWGDDFVDHLNGQFAIALWDQRAGRLLLVRDRVGIVPLFYRQHGRRLLFASEIKAMLAVLPESPRLDAAALDQLMTFWSPVSPATLFEGVQEVSPGCMVVLEDDTLRQRRYWDWTFPLHDDYLPGGEEALAEELHGLLVDATRLRLRSDVPVGAYLSGGLDSSVLVSLIHHHSDTPLRTFSIGFSDDPALDEGSYQQAMVERLGTDHSRIACSNRDVADRFVSTIWHTESPLLRTAPVPMGMLSGLVHRHGFKVVLTGEGADEVLGGYDIFKEAKIRRFWARDPDSGYRPALLKRLYPYLDISRAQALTYLKQFFGAGIGQPEQPGFSHLPRWNTTARCKEFFSDDLKGRLREDAMEVMMRSFPPEMPRWHGFNRAQYIEAKSLMGGYLLCAQGDRMLMQHSVEGRFPFLDHRVIEFANRLHPNLKMKVLNEKYLLKKAMRRYLPERIVRRYKQPYRAPDIAAFFSEQGHAPDYVEAMLGDEALRAAGYFDAGKVGRLVQKIRRGRAIGYKDNMALVGILSTQVWHELFVNGREGKFASVVGD